MTTFSDLVNDVLMAMEGYGLDQGRAAFLSADMGTQLPAPTMSSVVSQAGGSLTPGTYYYKVTALGTNSSETNPSDLGAATSTSTNKSLSVQWVQVSGATGYNVYRGTSSSSYQKLITLGSAATGYLDSGTVTPSGGNPPVANSTGLSFVVEDTTNIGPGIAEIESELVYIKSVNESTKTITLSADGRGYRNTTPAAHVSGTRVTLDPVLPRGLLKRKVNETIVGVYPKLFGVAVTSLSYDPMKVGYEMPTDTDDILKVSYQALGPSQDWLPVRTWNLDKNADTTYFPSGKALNILDSIYPVSSIRVVYQKRPSELVNDTDDLTTTGLSTSARAAIVAGTVWRLASFIDISRIQVHTVEATEMASPYQMGTGTQVSSYLRKQYETELADEQQRQQLANPPIMHWEG